MAGSEHAQKSRRSKAGSGGRSGTAVMAPAKSARPASTRALTVGHAFDPAEAAADNVADQMIARLRGDDHAAHDHAGSGEHEVRRAAEPTENGNAVVGVAGGELPDEMSAQIEGKRGSGRRLGADVRDRMEAAVGADLGDVRVHTDDEAARLAGSMSARAFTTGKDIFFGAGEYSPATPDGERVLAHELAHTLQQGSGIGRTTIRRYWDLKAKSLNLHAATHVRALPQRPIYFLSDDSGDEVVVKSEDQPVGLGQLIGSLHKQVKSAGNVEQRKLSDSERGDVAMAIDVADMGGSTDSSWAKRGAYIQNDPKSGADKNADPYEVAFDDARAMIRDRKRNLMVMGFAHGESGQDKAETLVDDGKGGKISQLRTIYEDEAHLKALGRLTASDLFVGNLDRFFQGNIGNWFYNPNGSMTVIDNVDGGIDQFTTTGMNDPTSWYNEAGNAGGAELKKDNLLETANNCLKNTASTATDTTGDKDMWKWWSEKSKTGDERRDKAQKAVAAGLAEGKAQIVKTFTSTRFSIGRKKERAAKKAIKAEAKKANQVDQDDEKMQGVGDYYEILKARAKWLAKV